MTEIVLQMVLDGKMVGDDHRQMVGTALHCWVMVIVVVMGLGETTEVLTGNIWRLFG